ncbi:hypothetical protein AX16_009339, partial [Volvariella volvacea WC 439]
DIPTLTLARPKRSLSSLLSCHNPKGKHRGLESNTSRYEFYLKAPTRDLGRQLNGDAPIEYIPPTIDCQLPERAAVAMLLSEQPDKLDAQQLRSLCIKVCSLFVRLDRLREPTRSRDKKFLSKLAEPASKPSPSPTPDLVNVPSPEASSSPPPFSPSPSPVSPSAFEQLGWKME